MAGHRSIWVIATPYRVAIVAELLLELVRCHHQGYHSHALYLSQRLTVSQAEMYHQADRYIRAILSGFASCRCMSSAACHIQGSDVSEPV
ncbi:hypothetical protein D5086_017119 [Populus alba]|uniref:Uncharacterized protein n=1 Tax=Populus alba TaxID=43335 RepID=A0ACC4BX83_POPAL